MLLSTNFSSQDSFQAADRDFATTEKKASTAKIELLDHVKKVIEGTRNVHKFKVLDFTEKTFFNFAKAFAEHLTTADLQINSLVWFRIKATVFCKKGFDQNEPFQHHSILPSNMSKKEFLSHSFGGSSRWHSNNKNIKIGGLDYNDGLFRHERRELFRRNFHTANQHSLIYDFSS